MSIWQVPEPVKSLFETFPLKEYDSVPVVPSYANGDKYLLITKGENKDIKSTFQLGVYNVAQYLKDDNVIIPTDPICLSCQLIINLRNELSFPLRSLNGVVESGNFIKVISYHASYDNELPIFIEQQLSNKRVVNSTTLINDLQMTRNTLKQMMKCLAIDNILYDFWMITVIYELSTEVQSEIYMNTESDLLKTLVLRSTIASLITRYGFNIRNKYIAESFTSEYSHFWKLTTTPQIELERQLIMQKSKDLVALLNTALTNEPFLNNGKSHPGILDCKLAAIVYCVEKFAPNTKFGQLLENYPTVIEHSFRVIEKSL